MPAATHAYELLWYVAEANLQHATVESLLALVFQIFRPLALKLV